MTATIAHTDLGAREAVPYDFRRPTALAREQSRVLEVAFETFARQWGTQLTAKVRVRTSVQLRDVRLLTYDAYTAALPTLTTMVLAELPEQDAGAVVQFPAAAALAWIGHMLGSAPENADTPERELTGIEQTLVRRLMTDTLIDLQYSMGPTLMPSAPVVQALRFNAQFAQAAGPAEQMIVASFTVTYGDRSCPASLALPADAVLPLLGADGALAADAGTADRITSAVLDVPVDISVRLAPLPVLPSVILDLAVGDTIPISHAATRPLDVAVGDQVLASAAPGTAGSRLACVIVTTEEKPS
ncbi:flagellar motor switch protein FliM [Pseudactinotalea terrae]|uniref:flagellar motor switch protein FliM n=1 Tax=Pseudactinotalea terrae TaxID=1743262 RepID=UPI001F4FE303|nr:flagellar motor switch protein FliM [Pseudactinotalea terrae]